MSTPASLNAEVLIRRAGLALAHTLERAKREGGARNMSVTVYEQREGTVMSYQALGSD